MVDKRTSGRADKRTLLLKVGRYVFLFSCTFIAQNIAHEVVSFSVGFGWLRGGCFADGRVVWFAALFVQSRGASEGV